MGRVSTLILLIFVILVVLVREQECRGGAGRSRGGHRPSSSGTSYKSHPSPSSLSYGTHARPSPSYHPSPAAPSPSPSPSYGWGTQPGTHGTHGTQLGTQTNRGTATSRPLGFDLNNNQKTQNNYQTGSQPSAPRGPDVHNQPFNNRPGQTGSHPPIGFDNANKAAAHPVGSHPSPHPSAPIDNIHKQTYQGNTNSYPNRPIGWDIPPRPGATPTGNYHHQPQGPPISNNGHYAYQQYPHPQMHSGPTQVKIVNKYNYHYPGYYSVPQQHSYYPGYFQSTPSYHYSSFDTGSTALGFALGYSLAKITTPTYSHQSFYDGYRPRYDHYEVHHYYHNRDAVPQNQEIRSNSIVGCVGDAPQVCPVNTTSLCTSSGALMCVVSATSTVPCLNNRQVNCIRSQISCVNNTAEECKNAQNNQATINIPCISTAKIYGDLKVLNNTIVPKNVENATSVNNTSTSNTTSITTTPSSVQNETVSTQYPITTTPNPSSSASPVRRRRDADPAQNYCVTIVALPAAKKETEGEKLFKDAKDVSMKFLEQAWGL